MIHQFPLGEPLELAKRSLNGDHFQRVANDPAVRPSLGGDTPIKLKVIIDDVRNNYAFETKHGGFLLWGLGAKRYDVHSLFLPAGRGEEALKAMAETAAYMFTRTDCVEGRTMIPQGNHAARVLAERASFQLAFSLEHYPWTTDRTVRADFLTLTLERWALTAHGPLAAGRWFHDCLEKEKQAAGSSAPVHPDEETHDRIAGATVMMVFGGQPEKAIEFYNGWALTTRYAPIVQLTKPGARPCVFDIGDAIIEARSDGMEVILCR